MAVLVPNDPATLLTRVDCAEALTAAGFPTSPATLATKATRGGGPPFRKFGPRVIYEWGSALTWAQSRLGAEVNSTSEFDTHRAHSGKRVSWNREPTLTRSDNKSPVDHDPGECTPVPDR
jgi:hypothetical protein